MNEQKFKLHLVLSVIGIFVSLCLLFDKAFILNTSVTVQLFMQVVMFACGMWFAACTQSYLYYRWFRRSSPDKIRDELKHTAEGKYNRLKFWWTPEFAKEIENIRLGS